MADLVCALPRSDDGRVSSAETGLESACVGGCRGDSGGHSGVPRTPWRLLSIATSSYRDPVAFPCRSIARTVHAISMSASHHDTP